MQQRPILSPKFFRPMTSSVLSEIRQAQPLLEDFYFHTPLFEGKNKVTLFETIIAISRKQGSEFAYIGYLSLDSDLRFQRMYSQQE